MRPTFLSSTLAALVACAGHPSLRAQASAAPDPAPAPQIAYQGRLVEGGIPAEGARAFVFTLLDSSGKAVWDSGATPVTIPVQGGLFSIRLGGSGMTPLPASIESHTGLKLHMTVGGVALAPDVDLVAGFQAQAAWDVLGDFAGDIVGKQTQITVSKLQGLPLDLSGGTPTAGQALVFDGTKWVAASMAGTPGPAGAQGPQGLQGATGPQGIQGATGPQGLQGATGPQGSPGLMGLPGNQGPQGVPGQAGANGLNGKTLLNGSGLPSDALGVTGDFYLDNDTKVLYGPKPLDGNWAGSLSTTLVGAPGATGPAGGIGPMGPMGMGMMGPMGLTGPMGPMGPMGDTGLMGGSPFTMNGPDATFTGGSLGVGTSSPDPSAILDLKSTTQGLLAPRMTTPNRQGISSPALGLTVFDTDLKDLQLWNGSAWVAPGSGATPGLAWRTPVKDLRATTPVSPVTGDRYIATTAWGGGQANDIGTYNGTGWTFATPSTFDAVFATNTNKGYVFNSGAWAPFNSGVAYTFSGGLSEAAGAVTVAPDGVGTTAIANGAVTAAKLSNMSATAGQVLQYNGSAWAPATAGGGSGTVTNITVASPLTITNASTTPHIQITLVPMGNGGTGIGFSGLAGNVLTSDGSKWVSQAPRGIVGSTNTAFGESALTNTATGTNDNAFGAGALLANVSGSNNNAFGTNALRNSTGSYNIGFGTATLALATGSRNVAIGFQALTSLTSSDGSDNVAIGDNTGAGMTGGAKGNVLLGSGATTTGAGANSATERIAIGYKATAGSDGMAVLGGTGTSAVYFGTLTGTVSPLTLVAPINDALTNLGDGTHKFNTLYASNGTINTSDARVKTGQQPLSDGLATLMKLQPKTYFKHQSQVVDGQIQIRDAGVEDAGFIAQEVFAVLPRAAYQPKDPAKELWGLNYTYILPYTVKAVQELKGDNDVLRAEVDQLKAELAELKRLLKP